MNKKNMLIAGLFLALGLLRANAAASLSWAEHEAIRISLDKLKEKLPSADLSKYQITVFALEDKYVVQLFPRQNDSTGEVRGQNSEYGKSATCEVGQIDLVFRRIVFGR